MLINKYIWLWWEQGWKNAPIICKATISTFEYYNKDYKIMLVSKNNFNDYIDKEYNWIFNCQGPAFRADIVRTLLLQKYGGVYSDATCFCCINLDNFLNEVGFKDFFTFDIKTYEKGNPSGRTTCSWFLVANPDNYIINNIKNNFLDVAKKNPINHPYFLWHFTLTKLVNNDNNFILWYKNLYKINTFYNRIDSRILHLDISTKLNFEKWFHPLEIKKEIDNKTFKIIKLRNNVDYKNLYNNNSIYSNLLNNYIYNETNNCNIFLLGFPKSGTTSFNFLFNKIGIKSYHWSYKNSYIGKILDNNIKNNNLLLNNLLEKNSRIAITQFDVCLDFNNNFFHQITHYKQIIEENKNDIFILNKRDKYKLLNSMKKWGNLDKRMLKYCSYLFVNMENLSNDEKILKLIDNHYENIELYMKNNLNIKFISFDIENDDLNKLRKYINIKNFINLPRENVNSK